MSLPAGLVRTPFVLHRRNDIGKAQHAGGCRHAPTKAYASHYSQSRLIHIHRRIMTDSLNPIPTSADSSTLTITATLIQEAQAHQAEALNEIAEQLDALVQRPLKIIDFNMPFGSLVGFMVKAAIASIPAALIIGVVYLTVVVGLGGFIAMLFRAGR